VSAPPTSRRSSRRPKEHSIDLVVTRAALASLDARSRPRARLGKGAVKVRHARPRERPAKVSPLLELFSTTRTCPRCGMGVPELDPRWFSFNTKQGQCDACEGSGSRAASEGEPTSAPLQAACEGSRLSPLPRAVRLAASATTRSRGARSRRRRLGPLLAFDGQRMALIAEAPTGASSCAASLHRRGGPRVPLPRPPRRHALRRRDAAPPPRGAARQRPHGGALRARRAHHRPPPARHPRLLANLRKLVDMGSTVLMVEHDADTIRAADHLVDLGPSGGRGGGAHRRRGARRGPRLEPLSPPRAPSRGERAIAPPRRPLAPRPTRSSALRRARPQPEGRRRAPHPRRAAHRRRGGERLGQEHARAPGAAPRVRKALKLAIAEPGAARQLGLPRSGPAPSRSTSRPSAARRARSPRRSSASGTRSASSSRRSPTRRCAATDRALLVQHAPAAAARVRRPGRHLARDVVPARRHVPCEAAAARASSRPRST
jgi:excinuclease ABC subunit A